MSALEQKLDADTKGKVNFKPIEDPGVTGNFEVVIDGELVHSKRTKNEGFLHTNEEKLNDVIKKIKEKTGKSEL